MEHRRSETDNNDLDLAAIMDEIRRNAQKRKLQSHNVRPSLFAALSPDSSDLRQLRSLPTSIPLPPKLEMQPALERRDQYQIDYLLGFHDEAFVRNAFKVILKREPDDAGFSQFVKNLRSGRYSKIDILRSLRFSAEGEQAGVSVKGLTRASLFRKIYRVPVLGYVAQLVVAIFRLPVLIANYRRLESHTAAQLDRLADHANEVGRQFSETAQSQSEAHRRQMEVLLAQVTTAQQQLENLALQIESFSAEHEKLLQDNNALKADVALRIDETTQQMRAQANIVEIQKAELETLKDQLEQRMQRLAEQLQSIRMDIAQQENRLGKLVEGGQILIEASPGSVSASAVETERDHLLDSLYRSLEDELRGNAAEIKQEVKVYLPVLHAAGITGEVLDVGCGRGEWLEVLHEAGIQATGVDFNRILIRECKEKNLDVIEAEALAYLRSLSDETLSAVTALHVAEHLPLRDLVSFLDEVARILKPNGLLILETPNPENLLVGSCNFYLDPTHKNPIPTPTMKLLVEARGFQCQQIMKLHPVATAQIEVKDQLTSHLNHYLYGPMNYAVVARKPEQA
jgi:2-polyprenyl-3-methyl-5-hydroxy-6-metoxy-1,4-benzoquinol methylase